MRTIVAVVLVLSACSGDAPGPHGADPVPPPPCAPACTNRQCGSDGCGGSCGTCAAAWTCSLTGTCLAPDFWGWWDFTFTAEPYTSHWLIYGSATDTRVSDGNVTLYTGTFVNGRVEVYNSINKEGFYGDFDSTNGTMIGRQCWGIAPLVSCRDFTAVRVP